MRVLVLGADGMMGHMACRVLAAEHEVFGTTRRPVDPTDPLAQFLPRDRWAGGVEASRIETVEDALARLRPDAVFNCVGIVKQLAEANDAILSIECNALFPHRLASLCSAAGARLLHMSTDCVFSGSRGSYTEKDNPDPVDLYGRAKLLGETVTGSALTLRTSIVGRQLHGRSSLFEWVISSRGSRIRGYSRAIYSGLTTMALARIVGRILSEHPALGGILHVASRPITKLDLIAKLNASLGLGITIEGDDTFVCDRSLDGSAFARVTGIAVPSWDEMIEELRRDQVNYARA